MERTAPRTPEEMAHILLAISIVSRNMAEEILHQDATEPEPQLPPIPRRRRAERYTNEPNEDWR